MLNFDETDHKSGIFIEIEDLLMMLIVTVADLMFTKVVFYGAIDIGRFNKDSKF
jgi:hypothetical protein